MDKKYLKIKKLNNVNARIITNHPFIMNDVINHFSVYIENYWFQPKVKAGLWDGKIRFVNKDGTFPIGLLKQVYNFVKSDELDIQLDKDLVKYSSLDNFDNILESWLSSEWIPRTHQIDGAKKIIKYRRGILEHATSSGKSLTIAIIAMHFLLTKEINKVLILVPTLGLIEQMRSDLISYGIKEDMIGRFNGECKDKNQSIIISTWQSMCKQKELSKEFDMLICDETHSLKGDVVRSVSENCINAEIRIGCTGTMPDHKSDEYRVISTLGPVLHRVTTKELIEKGDASDIAIKILYLNYPEEVQKQLKNAPYELEKKYLESSKPRANIIKCVCKKHLEKEHNILILVNKLDHADFIYNNLKELNCCDHIFLVTGDVDPEERERIRKFTNINKKVIIVATSGVFSTGISIKRLHAIIFAAAGKSKIRTLQSVGRGLRLHKEKNKLFLYDIGDSLKYSDAHLDKRIKFYDKAEFSIDVKDIQINGSI